ncbi:MAG: Cof-type HAD-IIB family hydrolase [Tepidisphaeraceae bacterium]|jgi:Cof subfamily protein (haloacid dehalogenase superfamily)
MKRQAVSKRRIPPQARQIVEHPIRLLAVDLDGTLLNDAKRIGSQTVDALADLPRRGVKVVIASARPPRSVRHIYAQLGLDTWQINYNGALIWDEPNKQVIFHRPMTGQLVRQIIDLARAQFPDILITCEVLDRWFTDRFEQTYTTETGRLFKPDVIAPLDQFCVQPITKLLLLGDPEKITALEAILAGPHDQQVTIVRTDPQLLQIMDKHVGKSAALQMIAEHYQVPLIQVMSIGDAPNDVGMLQLAGVAVAMDNAHDLVKKAAHWIAPSNNQEGVRAALAHYGLCD